jgi:hypothetical protein
MKDIFSQPFPRFKYFNPINFSNDFKVFLINFGEFLLKKNEKFIFVLDSINNLQEECSQIVDLNDKAKKNGRFIITNYFYFYFK